MNTSPTHVRVKKKRNLEKCTLCRLKKIKCSPQPRDWENAQQKCDYCEDHNKACGPNYKNKDDPEVIRRGTREDDAQEEGSSQESIRYPVIEPTTALPITDASGFADRNENEPTRGPLLRSFDAGQGTLPALPVEELREKALSNLSELNALGVTLQSLGSRVPLINAPCNSHVEPSYAMFIKEALHRSFISIYKLGVQAYEKQLDDQARWILLALLSALNRYPVLCDGQKRGQLLKMANMFQGLGHPWQCEHILELMTQLNRSPTLSPDEDPCLRLAESLPKTSEMIRRIFTTLWKDTVGDDDTPSHFSLPALQRAAQIPNAGVASAILTHQNGIDSRPAMFGDQSRRVANYLGTKHVLPRLGIDDRDLYERTALFVAAAHGFDQCCLTLILGVADPNIRDHRGQTALEQAAKRGYLEVVKLLIGVGADVNPQLLCCTSSPLQAALERSDPNKELVHYLLDQGASVSDRRLCDGRTAIGIADWKGHTDLADAMRRRTSPLSPYAFPFVMQDFGAQSSGAQDYQDKWP